MDIEIIWDEKVNGEYTIHAFTKDHEYIYFHLPEIHRNQVYRFWNKGFFGKMWLLLKKYEFKKIERT